MNRGAAPGFVRLAARGVAPASPPPVVLAVLVGLVVLVVPREVRGQEGTLAATRAVLDACAGVPLAPPVAAGHAGAPGWPAPLDRVVATRREPVTLQRALEELAGVARVRFSYSPELLPLARAVCLPAGPLPLGEALRAVLAGTELVPVVAGREQIVLTPGRSSASAEATPALARTLGRLERVVVTGTATGGTERASPFALNVIEGPVLERAGTQSVAQLLDGAVPGLWMWAQAPTSLTSRFGSVRGASSFGVTTPKVYIDGIEVANPLLLSQLDATRVQRIEVIRGPQGAALYGTDAISGVINVVTRQDDAAPGLPRAELRAGAGAASSAFAPEGVLAQEHGLQLRSGVAARSAGLAASMTTVGAYVPGAASRHVLASAGARRVGTRLALTGTARWQDAATDVPASPLLDTASSRLVGDGMQRLRLYTAGINATLQASEEWTHAFVAGIDGYRLEGLASDALPLPAVADSVRSDAIGDGRRVTLRASATRRLGGDSVRRASFTVGTEQSFSREFVSGLLVPERQRDIRGAIRDVLIARDQTVDWRSTGVLAQGQVAWREALFVHGGARVEHVSGLSAHTQVALLPMLGAAWVRELGPTSLKVRGAYGRGIRASREMPQAGGPMRNYSSVLRQAVEPEAQSGVEWGADLRWDAPAGARVALQATRFDQLASNLAQPVAIINPSSCYLARAPGGAGLDEGACRNERMDIGYELQNVGEIANDGWELQASVARGPLAMASSLALVESRVRRVRAGYGGDLRPGDRMLEVPARTAGLSASWTTVRWSFGTTVARAYDWINYDRVALAAAFVSADSTSPPVGGAQRAFWRRYDGVTRIGARLDVTLWRATALTLRADNLLDRQFGEPDNITVLPGRTVVLGVRTGF